MLIGGKGADNLHGGSGADKFHFNPGHGADVITDFINDADRIRLESFGLESAQSAPDLSSQVDDDVVFDFGGGDMLTLEDVTIGQLQDDLVIIGR